MLQSAVSRRRDKNHAFLYGALSFQCNGSVFEKGRVEKTNIVDDYIGTGFHQSFYGTDKFQPRTPPLAKGQRSTGSQIVDDFQHGRTFVAPGRVVEDLYPRGEIARQARGAEIVHTVGNNTDLDTAAIDSQDFPHIVGIEQPITLRDHRPRAGETSEDGFYFPHRRIGGNILHFVQIEPALYQTVFFVGDLYAPRSRQSFQ